MTAVLKGRWWVWVGICITCWVVGTSAATLWGWWGFLTLVSVPFIVEFWDWLHDTVAS